MAVLGLLRAQPHLGIIEPLVQRQLIQLLALPLGVLETREVREAREMPEPQGQQGHHPLQ